MTSNVADEMLDSDSIWSLYRDLIQIRNQHAALRVGDMTILTSTNDSIISFLRMYEDEAILVIMNISDQPVDEVLLAKSESSLSEGIYQLVPILGSGNFISLEINLKVCS
jgi:glycosidase